MCWLRLTRRTAIVTGAASGIGSSVARALASEGCGVVLADVDETALEGEVGRLRHDFPPAGGGVARPGGPARGVRCDVTDPDSVHDLVAAADDLAAETAARAGDGEAGPLPPPPPLATILVNCAGVTQDALLPKMSVEQFDRVVDVNLKGTWLACRHFCDAGRLGRLKRYRAKIEALITDGSAGAFDARCVASIVNLSSVVARAGNIGQTNYAASKGGVLGLTRALAKEMARYGVRANAILPGFIDTPMTRAIPEKVGDAVRGKIAMGGFGRVEDVSNLALFLASDRSGYVTGECVECSGMAAL